MLLIVQHNWRTQEEGGRESARDLLPTDLSKTYTNNHGLRRTRNPIPSLEHPQTIARSQTSTRTSQTPRVMRSQSLQRRSPTRSQSQLVPSPTQRQDRQTRSPKPSKDLRTPNPKRSRPRRTSRGRQSPAITITPTASPRLIDRTMPRLNPPRTSQ